LGGVLSAIGVKTLGYILDVLFGNVAGIDKYFTLLVLAWLAGLITRKPASVEEPEV